MSNFRTKIIKEIIEPSQQSQRVTTIVGTVVKTDKNNTCVVNFTDKDGVYNNNKRVGIRMYGDEAWTPKTGSQVLIEQDHNTFTIIGYFIEDWSNYKNDHTLKADIFSNLVIDTSPGTIF